MANNSKRNQRRNMANALRRKQRKVKTVESTLTGTGDWLEAYLDYDVTHWDATYTTSYTRNMNSGTLTIVCYKPLAYLESVNGVSAYTYLCRFLIHLDYTTATSYSIAICHLLEDITEYKGYVRRLSNHYATARITSDMPIHNGEVIQVKTGLVNQKI